MPCCVTLVAHLGEHAKPQQQVMDVLDQAARIGVVLEEERLAGGCTPPRRPRTAPAETGASTPSSNGTPPAERTCRPAFTVEPMGLQPQREAILLRDAATPLLVDKAITANAVEADLSEAAGPDAIFEKLRQHRIARGEGGAMPRRVGTAPRRIISPSRLASHAGMGVLPGTGISRATAMRSPALRSSRGPSIHAGLGGTGGSP